MCGRFSMLANKHFNLLEWKSQNKKRKILKNVKNQKNSFSSMEEERKKINEMNSSLCQRKTFSMSMSLGGWSDLCFLFSSAALTCKQIISNFFRQMPEIKFVHLQQMRRASDSN